jgi:hypothetical protein
MIIKNVIRLKITISHWLWSGDTAVGSIWCIMVAGINHMDSSNRNISHGFQFLKLPLRADADILSGAILSNFAAARLALKFVAGSGNTLIVDVVMLVILR